MDLGEHIVLTGLVEDEFGELTIAKKLIGNHVKTFIASEPGYERLELTVDRKPAMTHVTGFVLVSGTRYDAEANDANVFFALDRCCKKLWRETRAN